MIKVTRINDTKLVINADLIEFVESIPDTMISLTTGKKIMVKETIDDIIGLVAGFKRLSTSRMSPPGNADVPEGVDHGG
jgi:flagellar protein FlbD